MDEVEWDRCEDVRSLLAAFGADWKSPDDENWFVVRKFRLFFCALVRRRAWPILQAKWRRLVGYVEKLSDQSPRNLSVVSWREGGVFTDEEMKDLVELQRALLIPPGAGSVEAIADHRMNDPLQASTLRQVLRGRMLYPSCSDGLFTDVVTTVERYCNPEDLQNGVRIEEGSEATVEVIRCVLGNPFRLPVIPDSHWLTWNHGVVTGMAGEIYEERSFDDMPILADGLEDSGCDDAHVLGHCRDTRGHWRGCWVLDMLRSPGDPTARV